MINSVLPNATPTKSQVGEIERLISTNKHQQYWLISGQWWHHWSSNSHPQTNNCPMGKHEPAQLTASTAVYLLVREKRQDFQKTIARLDIWIFQELLQQCNTVQSLLNSSASDKYWEADISKPTCSSLSLWRKSPVLSGHSKLNWRALVNDLNNARFVIMYTCREGVAYPHTIGFKISMEIQCSQHERWRMLTLIL